MILMLTMMSDESYPNYSNPLLKASSSGKVWMCESKYSPVSTMSKVAIEIKTEFIAAALLGNKMDDRRGRKTEIC